MAIKSIESPPLDYILKYTHAYTHLLAVVAVIMKLVAAG